MRSGVLSGNTYEQQNTFQIQVANSERGGTNDSQASAGRGRGRGGGGGGGSGRGRVAPAVGDDSGGSGGQGGSMSDSNVGKVDSASTPAAVADPRAAEEPPTEPPTKAPTKAPNPRRQLWLVSPAWMPRPTNRSLLC